MTPKLIGNPMEFKVDPAQLADLDATILKFFPTARLDEGVRFARHAKIPFEQAAFPISNFPEGFCAMFDVFPEGYEPDGFYEGITFGRWEFIFFWMPFFD